jgi:hypothetical protein
MQYLPRNAYPIDTMTDKLKTLPARIATIYRAYLAISHELQTPSADAIGDDGLAQAQTGLYDALAAFGYVIAERADVRRNALALTESHERTAVLAASLAALATGINIPTDYGSVFTYPNTEAHAYEITRYNHEGAEIGRAAYHDLPSTAAYLLTIAPLFQLVADIAEAITNADRN